VGLLFIFDCIVKSNTYTRIYLWLYMTRLYMTRKVVSKEKFEKIMKANIE